MARGLRFAIVAAALGACGDDGATRTPEVVIADASLGGSMLMVKVDIYVLTRREFDQTSFGRRTTRAMPDEPGARVFHLDTAEDTVLHKLEWYRAGGEVSDRQWSDITGVLQVQHDALDFAYLDRWAAELGVVDLLARARRDAGEPG